MCDPRHGYDHADHSSVTVKKIQLMFFVVSFRESYNSTGTLDLEGAHPKDVLMYI